MYFDGCVTDGESRMRIVGFSSEQQRKLACFKEKEQAAHLVNCEIKRSREGDKMELMLKKWSKIDKSEKNITIPDNVQLLESSTFMELKDVQDMQEFQRVSAKVKVVYVNEAVTVTGGSQKQDVIVADSSAWACLTLWEEMVNTMNVGISYSLVSVMVKQYGDQQYLCLARSGSHVETIEDIGNVIEYIPSDEGSCKLVNVTVVGVMQLDLKKICCNCKGRVESLSSPVGRCTKCLMTQRMEKCSDQVCAKLMVEPEGESKAIVHAFG